MRLAILADIHGNLAAFEAVLEDIAQQSVDQIIIAGDIVNGAPDSDKCWQLAQSLNCPMVRGNQDRYVFDYGTPTADPAWESERFLPVRWANAQLTQTERDDLAALPLTLQLLELPDLFIAHASARNDQDSLKAFTPEHLVAKMFANVAEQTIIRGHNHIEHTRHWQGKQIITVGTTGWAVDGVTTARYSIVERRDNQWHNTAYAVPYDVERALRRFDESGYLEATYPIGRLFLRELATATYNIVPFLRLYFRWQVEDPDGVGALSLADAIDHFLGMY